ncbi:MAG: hypothetical protein KGL39_03300 [Patescibacteria group bacterium]|nr:hypothetical protein [Patescibacteria group bacterium]
MVAPAASGIFKQVRIDAETTYGVAPSAGDTGAYILRRVTCDVSPQIATFRSNEIRPDRQLVTFRHGTEQVRGTLRGELSPGSYKDIFASLLGGAWATGAISSIVTSGNTVTAAAAAVNTSPGTFTRASGSWITDGLKIGDIIRVASSSVAANNNRNYRITGLTPLVMSVGPTPTTANPSVGLEAVAAGTDNTATVTFTVVGKKLTTPDPLAGGTLLDPSFTLEQYFSDQALYELYTGCKPSDMRLAITPSGLVTADVTFMGHSFSTGSSAYFTAPTAAAATDATSGVVGLIRLDDNDLGLVTSMNLTINGGHTVDPVIGSQFVPFIFPGILDVSGSLSLLFYDETYFNAAINETAVDLFLELDLTAGVANSDFLSMALTNVKLNSVTKDDGPKAIIGTYSFQALKQTAGGTGTAHDSTTIAMQDSTL